MQTSKVKYLLLNFLLIAAVPEFWCQNQSFGSANEIRIPGGDYTPLYSLDSQQIEVEPFLMDDVPVTNNDFLEFVKAYPEYRKSKIKPLFSDHNYLKHWENDTTFESSIAESPVVFVSWFAAKKYCECQGKRLPTNAEWEIAGRASADQPDARDEEGFNEWLLSVTLKSSSKQMPPVNGDDVFENYYGIKYMHTHIWEWTFDFSSALTTGESRGDSSLDKNLFCGGGSFAASDLSDYVAFMRFAMRSGLKAEYNLHNLGFRCASDIENETP